jgi:DNA-binding phage protein
MTNICTSLRPSHQTLAHQGKPRPQEMPKTTLAAASNEVADLLREAMDRGHLIVLHTAPSHDDAKTLRLIALNQLFKLSPAQGRALVQLMEQKQVTRAELHRAMAHDGNPTSQIKTIDVILSKMRAKLRPYGVEITTVHGLGFRLAEDARDKIHKLLAEHGAEIITPAEPAAAPSD